MFVSTSLCVVPWNWNYTLWCWEFTLGSLRAAKCGLSFCAPGVIAAEAEEGVDSSRTGSRCCAKYNWTVFGLPAPE